MTAPLMSAAGLAVCLSGILAVECVDAQTLAFRNYGAEAGVAVANAMALDANGTLVVGTNDGLVRFDGFGFEPILLPGLVAPRIARLTAAADGTLWGLTDSATLFRLDVQGRVTIVTVPAALGQDLVELRSFHRLRLDAAGRVWINGTRPGVWRFDPPSSSWTYLDAASGHSIVDFFIEGSSTLWFATRDRVVRTPIETPTTDVVTWTSRLPEVVFLRPHSAGRAWLGTRAGAYLLNADGRTQRVLGEPFAAWWHAEPATDAQGRLLFTSGYPHGQVSRLGVMRLGSSGQIELPGEFHGFTPRQLLFGREGDFWLAHTGGLIHVEQEYLVSYPLEASVGTLEIAKLIVEDPQWGDLWISTWGGMYRLRAGRAERMSLFPRRATTHAVLARDGSRWWMESGAGGFVVRADGKAHTTRRSEHLVFESGNGTRFVAGPDGFYRKSGALTRRISARRFLAAPAAQARDGRIWISPEFQGVDIIEGDSLLTECRACGPASIRAIVSELRDLEVVDMRADGRGRVWIAAGRSGLICIFPNGQDTWVARKFGSADGLLSDEIHAIHPASDERLWVGSPRGVQGFRVSGAEPALEPLFEFRAQDGMIGEYVSTVLEDAAGYLWIGTSPGLLYRLDYQNVPRLASPSLRITRLETDGVAQRTGSQVLRLRSGTGRLTIQLAPETYQQVWRQRFEYRLTPLDATWIRLDGRSAQIAALPAGRHTFEARAVRPGQPPGPIIRQEFVAIAPIYQAWWFTLLVVALLLTPIALWYHLRAAKRLAAERLRARIASDLHDDLGSGLTQISLYSELIRRASEPQVAAWANQLGEQARSLSDGMRDIIWALHPQHDGWQALELRMKDHAASFLAPHGIAFDIQGAAMRKSTTMSVDTRRNVLLFFKEVLNNAVRHSACRRVQVRWQLWPQQLRLVISDDGNGFDPIRARTGDGLLNLRRRAADIGAAFHVHSAPGRGTLVELLVPLRGRHRKQNHLTM